MPKLDMTKHKGKIAIAAVVVIAAAGLGSRAWSTAELSKVAAEQSLPAVAVLHPKTQSGGEKLLLPADLQALNSAPIYARTTGYVRQWIADIGDKVHRGQVLAILDAPDVEQQLAAARADYQTAKANQDLAQSTATRWRTMLAQNAVARQAADEKFGDLAAKTATTNAARANVERLRTMAGFTKLEAPFDGVVTARNTQIGALIAADAVSATPLYVVSDVARIRAFVRIPQTYSGQVYIGMPVTLSLPEFPNRSFTASLVRTAKAVDTSSGTLLVELQLDNSDGALKPGAYAQAEFPLKGTSGAVTVPPSALIINERGTEVALLRGKDTAMLRPVTLGRDLGKVIEVVSGLSAKDAVIDSPPESLHSGDRVRVTSAGGPAR